MLIRVLTAGGPLAEATVRAAAHHGGPGDHIEVQLILDVRWLEPPSPGVEFMSMPYYPEEDDPAAQAFFQELDEKLETYGEICAEGSATFVTRRVLAMPDEAIDRAAVGADLLVLPHPNGASAEFRKAVQAVVAMPPVPLMLVAYPGSAQAATIQTEADGAGLNGSHVFLDSVLGGRVNRISVEPGTPVEPLRSLAPLVEESRAGDTHDERGVDPAEMYVVLHAERSRGVFGFGSAAKRRLAPQRNLLLVPDSWK
jgi:hypothetical protein